jgi:hypothetical protein
VAFDKGVEFIARAQAALPALPDGVVYATKVTSTTLEYRRVR